MCLYRTRAISKPVFQNSHSSVLEAGPGRAIRAGIGTTPAIWPFSAITVRCPRKGWRSL